MCCGRIEEFSLHTLVLAFYFHLPFPSPFSLAAEVNYDSYVVLEYNGTHPTGKLGNGAHDREAVLSSVYEPTTCTLM